MVRRLLAEAEMFRAISERLDIIANHFPTPRLMSEQAHELGALTAQSTANMIEEAKQRGLLVHVHRI